MKTKLTINTRLQIRNRDCIVVSANKLELWVKYDTGTEVLNHSEAKN